MDWSDFLRRLAAVLQITYIKKKKKRKVSVFNVPVKSNVERFCPAADQLPVDDRVTNFHLYDSLAVASLRSSGTTITAGCFLSGRTQVLCCRFGQLLALACSQKFASLLLVVSFVSNVCVCRSFPAGSRSSILSVHTQVFCYGFE